MAAKKAIKVKIARFVDKLAIAWTDDWNVEEDSDALIYQYYGEISGDLFTTYYYDGLQTPGASMAFESLDLKELTPDGSEHTTNHSGWGKVEIYRPVNQTAEPDDFDITTVLSRYYHKKLGLSGTLTYG